VKRALVVGLTVFAVMALPVSARADMAKSIVESAATAVGMSILCASVALTADDEIDPDDFARRGWLVGVAGSYAIETFEQDANSDLDRLVAASTNLSVDNSFGFNGRVGYRCHSRFSVEAQFEWLDGFDSDFSTAGGAPFGKIKYEPFVATANTKGYLLTGRYQPFLLVGAGMMTADARLRGESAGLGLSRNQSDTAFAMRFGGGIDLYATKNLVVSLETDYVLPFGNLDALDYVSIGWGIQYRF
jgi:opacity protein-like surface antigen